LPVTPKFLETGLPFLIHYEKNVINNIQMRFLYVVVRKNTLNYNLLLVVKKQSNYCEIDLLKKGVHFRGTKKITASNTMI